MLPAIVLGIGGTGKWVILDLKRQLEEKHGKAPQEIFLRAFDVTEKENPPVERFNFDPQKGEYNPERISQGPLLTLFGVSNLDKIAAQIEKKYSQLKEWMREEDIKYQIRSSAQEVREGAGQIRQASRISFFLNVDSIYKNLADAFNQVAPLARTNKVPIRFFIISSLAGGTGCGTFVDFVLLAHYILENEQPGTDCYFYGIFSLPRGFNATNPQELERQIMHGNCYAAWRELHRIQSHPSYGINYSQSRRDIKIAGQRLLTWCYLVDGDVFDKVAEEKPKPWFGVNPSIAEFVCFILEGSISQVERNWHNALTTAWAKPNWEANVYASYGIHKWLVDLQELKLGLAYKFSLKTLEHFLTMCSPGTSKSLVQDFMKDARNTGFFKNVVYQILEKGLKLQANVKYFHDSLKLGGKDDAPLPEPQLEKIPIPMLVTRRKFKEIKNEANIKIEAKIGSESDRWGPKTHPTTYGVLNYYFEQHGQRYRQFLKEFSKNILNNLDSSLDYYRAFLEELISVLKETEKKLSETFDEYNISKSQERITQNLEKAEKKNKIKAYLRHLAESFRLKQLDLLTKYYLEMINEAEEEARIMLEEANSMMQILQERKATLENLHGCLHAYRAGLRQIKVYSYLTEPNDTNEEKLFGLIFEFYSPAPGSLEEQIKNRTGFLNYQTFWQGIKWDFAPDGSLKFILPRGFPEINVEAKDWVSRFTQAVLGENPPFQNLSDLSIFDFLVFVQKDVAQFIDELKEKSAYLAFLSQAQQAQWHPGSLNVQGGENVSTDHGAIMFPQPSGEPGQTFFQDLVQNSSFKGLQFGQSNTDDRSSILVCQMTNFWSAQAFNFLIEDTIKDYRKLIALETIPVHVLPEEKLAAKIYETGLMKALKEEIRLLHPTLIAYLKDEELIKAFTYANIYKEIERDSQIGQYVYQVETRTGPEKKKLGSTLIEALENISNDEEAREQLKDFYQKTIQTKVGNIDNLIEELTGKFREIKGKIPSIDSDQNFTPEEKELYRVFAIVLFREINRFQSERERIK